MNRAVSLNSSLRKVVSTTRSGQLLLVSCSFARLTDSNASFEVERDAFATHRCHARHASAALVNRLIPIQRMQPLMDRVLHVVLHIGQCCTVILAAKSSDLRLERPARGDNARSTYKSHSGTPFAQRDDVIGEVRSIGHRARGRGTYTSVR